VIRNKLITFVCVTRSNYSTLQAASKREQTTEI